MTKAYWVVTYRSISNPDALAAYARVATPALEAHGARYLARGVPAAVHDEGLSQRTVVVEFPSLQKAIEAHESPEYRTALEVLGDSARRELRIVEGLE